MSFGLSPLPVIVTTGIIIFLVGDPYKPSFATVTGRGDNPTCHEQKIHDKLQLICAYFHHFPSSFPRILRSMLISYLVGGFSPPIWKKCSSNWIISPGIWVQPPPRYQHLREKKHFTSCNSSAEDGNVVLSTSANLSDGEWCYTHVGDMVSPPLSGAMEILDPQMLLFYVVFSWCMWLWREQTIESKLYSLRALILRENADDLLWYTVICYNTSLEGFILLT